MSEKSSRVLIKKIIKPNSILHIDIGLVLMPVIGKVLFGHIKQNYRTTLFAVPVRT